MSDITSTIRISDRSDCGKLRCSTGPFNNSEPHCPHLQQMGGNYYCTRKVEH